ncbi:MAG: acyl-CoA dehydrogenase family protein [Acidimicrobiia bacterium]
MSSSPSTTVSCRRRRGSRSVATPNLAVLLADRDLGGATVLAAGARPLRRRAGDSCLRLLSGGAVAAGYTRPDSGSDVAAARTVAHYDGDGWRINGAKMFTSVAEEATVVLMLRAPTPTSPAQGPHLLPRAARHRGRGSPARVHVVEQRTNATFYDDVYVSDEWRRRAR